MSEFQSPRVNAARLPGFVGRTVRLPCKVLNFQAGGALVEACDGGQVEVRLTDVQLTGTFVEIIGQVISESAIKFMLSLSLDSDKELDMKLVNDVVELTFDPRFKKMFPPQ
ncbi:replication factor A protein 3 [Paxillus ammoniavirescens]|nr:replication factor A protein 3 [Paxillus ammoniavirescens]